jgi:peptide/nickel transport system permease protein
MGETRLALRRFARRRMALAGTFFLTLLILGALAAPLVSPYDPLRQDLARMLAGPSPAHLLGTDDLGRDVLTRVLYGARLSLGAACLAVAIATLAGVPIGLVAGYLGGRIDDVLMRVIDALQAFPALILAMAIAAALGPGLFNVMVAVGVVYTPRFARLVRGQVLALREEPFVESARAAGATHARVLARHVLPNVVAPLVVTATLGLGTAILASAALSFLGLGSQPPQPEWGRMLSEGRDYLREAWWISTFPGLGIMLTVLGMNLLGDGLRDVLDPRLEV